ncbi:hypothetical protein BD560DRAFT_427103 [Blakeslea trispora]|nr:hypothetical protein BD560DRAFT_427103 [Blakeslea trispora]
MRCTIEQKSIEHKSHRLRIPERNTIQNSLNSYFVITCCSVLFLLIQAPCLPWLFDFFLGGDFALKKKIGQSDYLLFENLVVLRLFHLTWSNCNNSRNSHSDFRFYIRPLFFCIMICLGPLEIRLVDEESSSCLVARGQVDQKIWRLKIQSQQAFSKDQLLKFMSSLLMYNYGQSPHESPVPIKEESNKIEDNRNEDNLFYSTNQPAYSSSISSSFNIRYPPAPFDSNSFVHNHLHNQDVFSRNQDHSIHTFNAFHSIGSSQDIVASLTHTPVFDHVDSLSTEDASTITTTATVLPPLNTTPIVVAPLQHHPATSHQTYLLAHKKPLKGSPRPSRERAPWTPEEDNLLKLAVQLYGDKTEKWAKIAACVPGRTNKNCRKRWFHSLDPSLRKGAWTEEEDQLLREGVSKFPNQWSKIADMLPGRTDDQCAKRWRESLDPSIDRSEWTAMEDRLLLEKYEEYGSQWQKIAFFFDGRPGLHCRNRWRKLQRLVQMKKDKEGVNLNASFFNTMSEGRTLRFQHTNSATLASNASPLTAESSEDHDTHQQNTNAIQHLIHHTNHSVFQIQPTPSSTSSSSHTTQAAFSQISSLLSQHSNQHDPSILVQFANASGDHPVMTTTQTTTVGSPPSPTPTTALSLAEAAAAAAAAATTTATTSGTLSDEFDDYGNGIKPYGCDVPGCYHAFAASADLFCHMKSCHPNLEGVDKPYRCAMVNCQKKYKNINGLQYHIKDAKGTTGHGGGIGLTGEDDRPFRCTIGTCKKAYRTASGFRYHQRNGHNIQPTINDQHMNQSILSTSPQQPLSSSLPTQQQQQAQFRMKREKWVLESV